MGAPAASSVAGLAQPLLGRVVFLHFYLPHWPHRTARTLPQDYFSCGVGVGGMEVSGATSRSPGMGMWLPQPPAAQANAPPATEGHFCPSSPHLSRFLWKVDPAEIAALTVG